MNNDFVKLNRKHEHDDKIADALDTTRVKLENNWQPVAIALGVVVLIVVGVWFYLNQQGAARETAQKQFSDAMTLATNGQVPDAIMQMGEIVRLKADKKLTADATFMLGSLYFDTRNYADAQKYFTEFLALNSDNELQRASAISGQAYILANQGDFAGAAAKFIESNRSHPNSALVPDNFAEAVRCYLEANDLTNARVAYDSLVARTPSGPFFVKATRLMAEKGAFSVK